MKPLPLITLLAFVLSCLGCSGSFAIRDANTYRKDTRKLLSTKNDAIKACYDKELEKIEKAKKRKKVKGKVVVKFTVAEDTGLITDAKIDEQETNAPASLSECVLSAIDGLALEPPDEYPGMATFTWKFRMEKQAE